MKPRHLILMLLALITSINVSAYTWTDANGTEWNFTTWGSKATITNRGYNNNNGNYIPSISGTIPTELTIPTTVYNGVTAYTVTSIGNNAFSGCSSLTSVTIPEGVTSIGEWAFDNCTSLTSITIPEGVTSIGVVAFYYCSGLTSITIPEGVTSIGGRAFEGCSSLTSITIPNSVTSIGDYAFSDCSSLTSITIPESVTSIGNYAFCSCSSLTSITISEGVTRIGNNAFSGCTRLTSINIPESVTSIGDYAFYQCSSLNSVNIPSTVTSIGQTAFGQTYMIVNFASTSPCTQGGLTESVRLVVPHESVDAYREAWSDISNAIVDATQTEKDITVTASESESAVAVEIGEDKLINVLKLKVTGTINSYDLMVFRNKMVNLVDLDLSDANVVANSYCYYSTISSKDNIVTSHFVPSTIKSLKLPKDITAMDGGALGGCNCITSISIPEGVKSIGNSAFYNCFSLTSVTIPEGVTSIGNYAFSGCSKLATVTIPEGVPSIGGYAFQSCSNLTSITIPESVTSIGEYAFSDCSSLSSISLPKNLTSIGGYAFQSCTKLTSIHLPPYLTSISYNVFYSCSNLKTIYAYMPDIISISTNTFNDYKHQALYVPEFLYNNYYYDTNWSQFLNVNPTDLQPDDYKSLSIQKTDISVNTDGTAIPKQTNGDAVDVEVGTQGSFTAGEDLSQTEEYAQFFLNADVLLDGEGKGGSLIGEDDGVNQGNLRVNNLRVKINVKAGRWYFFCFPYDVTIASCTYPGQYAWRYYDGEARATNGSGGWTPVEGETLNARQGYAFQTSHTGNLIISFSTPKFGGNRLKELVAHAAANAANASWNLIGNPFSSFYDFLADDFDAPITLYNSNGTYSAYRPADDECHLQPFEAFFVQKPSEVDAITFKPGHRESYNQGQTKKSERSKIRRRNGIAPERRLINMEIFCGDQQADRTRVVLNDKKSHDYELDCDASKFLSNAAAAQLYSIESGVKMAINERPQQGDIRLGYTAAKAGTLSISASRMDLPMTLVDTELGTTFDLSLGAYDFETAAGTFDGRFLLRMSGEATAINALTAKTGVAIGTQDGGIAIGGAEGKTVNVYTLGGSLAAQHDGNGFIALKSGMYVVSVDGESAKVNVK